MKEFLNSFNILTKDEIAHLIALSTPKLMHKGDFFIREGEICEEVAFVVNGTLRSFILAENGEEMTYCITFPNNLMTAYSSFITGQPTEENIQAVSTVELLIMSKNTINDLANTHVNWLKFLKVVAEQQYIELEKRIFQLQKNNAVKRYSELLKHQPEYVKHIPLNYLASYLNVTQRHLSRIRKEINF
ncbi:MAG: Crp/Fnr family transcriptional regulator [Bacteroidetes bacterium]|nr:MAG: Crp/Fnr family transcriptional regulator [Bacteroidota bacterium]